jgi:hypothetical protein
VEAVDELTTLDDDTAEEEPEDVPEADNDPEAEAEELEIMLDELEAIAFLLYSNVKPPAPQY